MKYAVIASYEEYNQRRYSTPWVAMVKDGAYDFTAKVGGYTGRYNSGEAGDLFVTSPVEDQIYAYGQKDYRNSKNTAIKFALYTGGQFVECDKLGRIAKEA